LADAVIGARVAWSGPDVRGTNLLQSVELAVGLGMLLCFVALVLVPGVVHLVAGANLSPSVVVLCACLGLAAGYRLLGARRRR
jgi:hypothetical protein